MAFKNFGPKGLKWDACAQPIIFKPTIIHRFMTVIFKKSLTYFIIRNFLLRNLARTLSTLREFRNSFSKKKVKKSPRHSRSMIYISAKNTAKLALPTFAHIIDPNSLVNILQLFWKVGRKIPRFFNLDFFHF